MGNAISSTDLNSSSAEKQLTEQSINENLEFYRKWTMSTVRHLFKNISPYHDFINIQTSQKGVPSLHPNTIQEFEKIHVSWQEFYEVVYESEDFRIAEGENDRRKMFHPAAGEYAMKIDPDAEEMLADYLMGPTIRPGDEDNDDEAYTSDEPTDEEDEEEEEGGGKNGEDDTLDNNNPQDAEHDSDDSDNNNNNESSSDEESAAPEQKDSDDESDMLDSDDNEDEKKDGSIATGSLDDTLDTPSIDTTRNADGTIATGDGSVAAGSAISNDNGGGEADDDNGSAASSTSNASNTDSQKHTYVPNPLPESFDPALRSPIFFGYTYDTLQDVQRGKVQESAQKSEDEKIAVEKKISEKKEALKKFREEAEARKESRAKKLEKLRREQQSAKVQREGQFNAAEKSMPPEQFLPLKRQFEVDEEAAVKVAELEFKELTEHNEELDNEDRITVRNLEAGIKASIENESNLLPAGAKLERTSRIDMKDCVKKLDEASDFLDESQQKLDAMQEDLKGNEKDKSFRSMLILIEGQVEEGERQVEKYLQQLEEQEVLLERALRRKARENLVLPLYAPLATSMEESDFSVSFLSLVVALCVMCTDNVNEKLRFLTELFDFNDDQFLAEEELKCLLCSSAKILHAIGYLETSVEDDAIHSTVLRAFYQMNVDSTKGMTRYEARQWSLSTIQANRYLTTLFNADWKYGEMSTYQRQIMNPAHQFEIGLINMPDLKYHNAAKLIVFRPELDPLRKAVLHERALSMGADDPNKADYSKFLPKKKRRVTSNVVPLEHGHLTNLTNYRDTTMLKAANRLQNVYRGKLARQRAEDLAKKEAFYAARDIVIEEMKEKVAAEFKKKENETKVAKMKWDASVRMKQAKLRAQGKHLDRDGVVGLLMDEAIKAGTLEITERFRELAIQRGFEEREKEVFESDDPAAGKAASLAAAKKTNVFKSLFKREEMEIPSGDIVTPRVERVEGGKKLVSSAAQAASLSAIRRAAMLRGLFPPDLYATGETMDETALRFELMDPDPPLDALLQRLRAFDAVMTLLKSEDILLELPSKRLICKFIYSNAWMDDESLYKEFEKHFRLIRNSKQVVTTLRAVAESDLEHGIMANTYEDMCVIPDFMLTILVGQRVKKGVAEAGERFDKISRLANMKGLSNEEKIQQAIEKDDFDYQRRLKVIAESSVTIGKLEKKMKSSQIMLDESMRKRTNMILFRKKLSAEPIDNEILPEHRLDWMERFRLASLAPETNEQEASAKYYELSAVSHDFIATATKTAAIIIDEMSFPVHEKSIKPIDERLVDGRAYEGGRGDSGLRYKYEASGIRFKIFTDDHGLFNGSDEYSAKAAGNDCKASLQYAKCHMDDVIVPFQATIDYSGFRVLAVAKLPITKTEFNESGDIKRTRTEHVLGTIDRGMTVQNQSKLLDTIMARYAKQINLARHFVKGENDLNAREVYSSVDIRGFKGKDKFYLLNFWRGLPSENPKFTPHLSQSTRGNSIFWRMLRPEFVKAYKVPLSADANCQVTNEASDWIEQLDENERATTYLVETVIPRFAEELRERDLNGNVMNAYGIDLTADMHREGINMRHLGLIRKKFWRKLSGTGSLNFHTKKLMTSIDCTKQVERGDQLKFCNIMFKISLDSKDAFTPFEIPLDRLFNQDSINHQPMYAGEVKDDRNSDKIRDIILAEMIARTLKNIMRQYMRHAAIKMKVSVKNIQITLITEFLNIITGSHDNSDMFWQEQLYLGIVHRFGQCAIASSERKTFKLQMQHMIVYMVKRFTDMNGISLSNDCIAYMYDSPIMFRFVGLDVEKPGPRVKHNISQVDFADAVLLSLRADRTRTLDYQNHIVESKPFVYWKLVDRQGSRLTNNYGSGGTPFCGYYTARCEFEHAGPVKNEDTNRSVLFTQANKCKVDTKFCVELAPPDVFQHFAVEAWACVTGGSGTNRTVMMTGRAALFATREERWVFATYEDGVDVSVQGPPVEINRWTHLVGTYDGTMLRLYVDSRLVHEVELRPEVTRKIAVIQEERKETLDDLEKREAKARAGTKEKTEESAAKFLKSKEGRNLIRQNAIKLVEHSEFRMKMDKNAAEKGITKLSKKDAQAKAIHEYKEELYMKNVQLATEEFRKLREDIVDQFNKEDEYAREMLTKAMCIGSSVSSRRDKDGRNFFDGKLCHIAAYTRCLSTDEVRKHYQSAHSNRTPEADRLYTLSTIKFQKALGFTRDDPVLLEKYATNLCNYLHFDDNERGSLGDRKSKRKVAKAINELKKYRNLDGMAEIIRRLPSDPEYSDLACDAYTNILQFDPGYFKQEGYFTLRELSYVPFKFYLTDPGTDAVKLSIAADIFRKVVSELSLATCYGDQQLNWLKRIESDATVVSMVIKAQTDADNRIVDLAAYHNCSDIDDSDLASLADNHRLALVFNIKGSKQITDQGIYSMSRCCSSLQSLTIDGCEKVTGKALDGLKTFSPNLKLFSAQQCKFMEDEYLIPLTNHCKNLCILNLNNCDLVTDKLLRVLGKNLRALELLHLAFCTSITDEGIYSFAVTCNKDAFTSLDLTCCRSLTDDGLVGLAEKCTKLKWLNLCGVNRCTEVGGKAITHNCLDLEYLNLEDLNLITDNVFMFDSAGDGRRVVDENMLRQCTELNISECSRVGDRGMAGISHRCEKLKYLDISGCGITDEGASYLIREPTTGGARGGNLKTLKMSFCMNVSDEAVRSITKNCTGLTTIDLKGCVHITDDGVRQLAVKCTHLQNISISRCKRLTDKALCNLADFLWIEDLDISNNGRLTDDGIDVIAMEFSGLLKLNISYCEKITNRSIICIGRHCVHLRHFQIVGCNNVTADCIDEFRATLPKCECISEEKYITSPVKKIGGGTGTNKLLLKG